MRIGILTFHRSLNFGANLQAASTLHAFKCRGVDAKLINFRDPEKENYYKKIVHEEQRQAHERFFEERFSEGPALFTTSQLIDYCESQFDVIVVGSDAVFRVSSALDPIEQYRRIKSGNFSFQEPEFSPYFLHWAASDARFSSKLVVSLSASTMGTPYHLITGGVKAKLRESIRRFDLLSVRDDWTAAFVEHVANLKATLTPDPVFGLPDEFKEDVTDLLPAGIKLNQVIFLSLRHAPTWSKRLCDEIRRRGFQAATLPIPEDDCEIPWADFCVKRPLTPTQWYSMLAGAAGYIGIRFHALVSCTANATPALSIDHYKLSRLIKRTSKNWDLCQRAGLPRCFYLETAIKNESPERLLDVLLDVRTASHARMYSIEAKKAFSTYIDEIVAKASNRGMSGATPRQ